MKTDVFEGRLLSPEEVSKVNIRILDRNIKRVECLQIDEEAKQKILYAFHACRSRHARVLEGRTVSETHWLTIYGETKAAISVASRLYPESDVARWAAWSAWMSASVATDISHGNTMRAASLSAAAAAAAASDAVMSSFLSSAGFNPFDELDSTENKAKSALKEAAIQAHLAAKEAEMIVIGEEVRQVLEEP